MAAAFREVWKWSGVDETATSGPAMIVPSGGSNFVQLDNGDGLIVRAAHTNKHKHSIKIIDLADAPQNPELGKRRQAQLMLRPELKLVSGRRTFEIRGVRVAGYMGVEVEAFNPRTREVEARVRVVVLKSRAVKLSIRPVQVHDSNKELVSHSELAFEPKSLFDQIRLIVTPQTNIVILSGETSPVKVTDKALIARMLGLKAPESPMPETVSFDKFKNLFWQLRDGDADCTIFLARKVGSGLTSNGAIDHGVAGVMDSALKVGLVADEPDKFFYARTLAHEFCHFLGRRQQKDGTFVGFDDLRTDTDKLMTQGGAGWKIPLEHCLNHFNAGY